MVAWQGILYSFHEIRGRGAQGNRLIFIPLCSPWRVSDILQAVTETLSPFLLRDSLNNPFILTQQRGLPNYSNVLVLNLQSPHRL